MKQLLLRVPDEIHRRLAMRAARAGRSVNAVANEILDAAVDIDEGDRRVRLRSRAVMLDIARATKGRSISSSRRRHIIESTRGTGAVIDRFLDEERDLR